MAAFLVVGVLAIVAALTILRGVVLTYMWAWFLVPLGIPGIGVAHAIGIAMTVAIFQPYAGKAAEDETNGLAKLAGNFLGILLVWALGYLVAGVIS